jgi:DNA-binding MarR family transcriptional regulator
MTEVKRRGGPRAGYGRGPRGSEDHGDILKAQAERIAHDDLAIAEPARADSDPTNFHAHFVRYYAAVGEDALYFRMTRAIVVAARRWRKLANERVKSVDQTMARWETLFLVAFSDVELTQSDLARLINIEGPTLVRMLDLLAKEGLIDRRQSETDRRVTTNTITPAGRTVIDQIMGITNVLRREVLQDIPREELETALKVLSKIVLRINDIR